MAIPSQQELEERKKEMEERMTSLRIAYDQFLHTWNGIEQKEYALLKEYNGYVEKGKIHDILKQISDIN